MVQDILPIRIGLTENTDLSSHRKLISICDEIKEAEGRRVSNVGGFQSFDLNPSIVEETIGNFIRVSVREYLESILFDVDSFNITIENYWLNVNNHGNSNLRHTHPFVDFACVYYLKAPENSGAICLVDPSSELKMRSAFNSHVYTNISMSKNFAPLALFYKQEPKEGGLIIFPAHVPHEVVASESEDERMSLAFNISVLPK